MPLTVLTVVRTRPEIIKLSCVIPALGRAFSDSGPLIEEASILGFPAVMLRDDHERPQGMDAGTVIMSGIAPQDVVDAVATTLDRHADGGGRPRIAADYDVDDVAWKVVNAIHSYPRYVAGWCGTSREDTAMRSMARRTRRPVHGGHRASGSRDAMTMATGSMTTR